MMKTSDLSTFPLDISPVITASYRSESMKGEMVDDIRHEIDRLAALDHEALKMEYLFLLHLKLILFLVDYTQYQAHLKDLGIGQGQQVY